MVLYWVRVSVSHTSYLIHRERPPYRDQHRAQGLFSFCPPGWIEEGPWERRCRDTLKRTYLPAKYLSEDPFRM